MITDDIKRQIDQAVLCWLATVSPDGQPNVSPKEVFCLDTQNRLLVADIASPVTAQNIGHNDRVCISLIDIFTQKGLKLSGSARYIGNTDPDYAAIAAPIEKLAGPHFPVRGIIVTNIDNVAPIIAPSWYMRPELSEAAREESVYAHYGVTPAY